MDPTYKALLDAVISLLTGGWPVAIVLVAVIYRAEIKKLIPRLRKAGPAEFDPAQITKDQVVEGSLPTNIQPQNVDLDVPPPPLVAEIEKQIGEEIDRLPPEKRVPMLKRTLANNATFLQHERTYNLILGSQIAYLRSANARPISDSEARTIYSDAKAAWPAIYDGFSFENWISFLKNSELVTPAGNGSMAISIKGRDFLSYLSLAGKPENRAG